MPRIIVTADPLSSEPIGEAPVLLDEQVQSVHLSTGHAAAQLIERLAWAIGDAESAERARPEPRRAGSGPRGARSEPRRERSERPARGRAPASRSRARRGASSGVRESRALDDFAASRSRS